MARVLIIDDEADLAEIAALVLEWAGHSVSTWRAGEPVVEAVRRHSPDVVILDWVLGDTTGDRVMDQLRADPALRGVRVVVMSALHGLGSLARALGAHRFIPKPFEPEELVRAVGDSLEARAETAD